MSRLVVIPESRMHSKIITTYRQTWPDLNTVLPTWKQNYDSDIMKKTPKYFQALFNFCEVYICNSKTLKHKTVYKDYNI